MTILNILYIEDEPLNQKLVQKMVKDTNYQLTVADTATEGLVVASETNFDLLIIDLQLPDMTGIDLIHKIRCMPQLYDKPIIMLTADSSKINQERVLAYGNTQFLTKPISRWKLLQALEKGHPALV